MSAGGRYGRIASAFIDRVAAVDGPVPSVVGRRSLRLRRFLLSLMSSTPATASLPSRQHIAASPCRPIYKHSQKKDSCHD